jgi:drug/metabolite transporter (DMT)-like permease
VSIVQPVSGVGLVGLAVYSHLFLKEKLHAAEWGAVALALAGTLGLGATSSEGAPSAAEAAAGAGAGGAAAAGQAATGGGAGQAAQPGALRMLGVVLLLSAGVLLISLLRQRHSHRTRRAGDRPAAASYGLQAGACFGLSAASCRIGARHPEGGGGGG